MSFRLREYDDLLIVNWDHPEAGDVVSIVQRIKKMRAERGSPICYISIIPQAGALPNDATRSEMSGNIEEILQECRSMHLVLEGKGLKQATKRMVAAGFFMLKGAQNMQVHECLADALQACELSSADTERVLRQAKDDRLYHEA